MWYSLSGRNHQTWPKTTENHRYITGGGVTKIQSTCIHTILGTERLLSKLVCHTNARHLLRSRHSIFIETSQTVMMRDLCKTGSPRGRIYIRIYTWPCEIARSCRVEKTSLERSDDTTNLSARLHGFRELVMVYTSLQPPELKPQPGHCCGPSITSENRPSSTELL